MRRLEFLDATVRVKNELSFWPFLQWTSGLGTYHGSTIDIHRYFMVLWVHMSIFFAHLLAGVQEVRTKLALAKAARSWGVNPGSRSTLVDWAYLGDHWGSSGVDAFLCSLLWEVTVIWRRSHHAHMMCHCLIVMIVSHNLLRVKACENSIPVFTPKLRPLVLCSSLQCHVYWPIRQPRLEECPCFSKCAWLNVIEAHFGRVQN